MKSNFKTGDYINVQDIKLKVVTAVNGIYHIGVIGEKNLHYFDIKCIKDDFTVCYTAKRKVYIEGKFAISKMFNLQFIDTITKVIA